MISGFKALGLGFWHTWRGFRELFLLLLLLLGGVVMAFCVSGWGS